jgi:hypothetical protein
MPSSFSLKGEPMKKLLIILMLLGITIYYDAELEIGWVWINKDVDNCTIIVQSSINLVTTYDSAGNSHKMTFDVFAKAFGEELLGVIKRSQIVIHRKPTVKEQPKITY